VGRLTRRVLEHRSTETDPIERGRGLGRALAPAVANTVRTYVRLLHEATRLSRPAMQEAGARVRAQLAARRPDLVAELDGIAAGSGQDVRLLCAVNARTELLAGVPAAECSLVARPGALAQTWDWHPALRASLVTWIVEQGRGRWFATVTEAGVLGKLGVSSAGLCVGLNFLRSSADGGVDGTPIHVLLRELLDRADSLGGARAELRAARPAASSCITLADREEVVAAELSPAGCAFVAAEADGLLVHTNHFLAPLAARDLELADGDGTLRRRAHLRAAARRDGFAPESLLRAHTGGPQPVCRHEDPRDPWSDRRATLAAVAMAPGRLRVAAGPPCEVAFTDVRLPG
jgi:isopenicillin-N N-acyltransferase-like protein